MLKVEKQVVNWKLIEDKSSETSGGLFVVTEIQLNYLLIRCDRIIKKQ